jgi:hypothetical protein
LCSFSITHSFSPLFSAKMATFFSNFYFFLFDFFFFFVVVVFCPFHLYFMTFCVCVCVCFYEFLFIYRCHFFETSIIVWWWCCWIPSPWLHRQFFFSLHCKCLFLQNLFSPIFCFFCLSMSSIDQPASKKLCSKNVENYIMKLLLICFKTIS